MEIERKGPDSEPKRGIIKYLSAELFHWKSEINQVKVRMNGELNGTCQWHLRSKIGVWQMPLFKFIRLEIWRWNLWFDVSKRLKYKYTIFELRCYECLWCNYECRMIKMIFFEWGGTKGDPNLFEERETTPLGDTVVSLGNMIVHYRVDSGMKINERKQNLESTLGNFEMYL